MNQTVSNNYNVAFGQSVTNQINDFKFKIISFFKLINIVNSTNKCNFFLCMIYNYIYNYFFGIPS